MKKGNKFYFVLAADIVKSKDVCFKGSMFAHGDQILLFFNFNFSSEKPLKTKSEEQLT